MLLHDSRREARVDARGAVVLLEDQDRSLWDRGRIREGERVLEAAMARGSVGPYQLQAAIAARHATAPSVEETDFAQIAALYELLARIAPSPVVEVNRAVAVGRAHGAAAGLNVLAPVLADRALDGYAPLHAAHADLLERAGDAEAARRAWERAAACAGNEMARSALALNCAGTCAPPRPSAPPARSR
jgi:RNA polymerase sigma-70 factor (ECF subfamily)